MGIHDQTASVVSLPVLRWLTLIFVKKIQRSIRPG
jgi:hypothetical protein